MLWFPWSTQVGSGGCVDAYVAAAGSWSHGCAFAAEIGAGPACVWLHVWQCSWVLGPVHGHMLHGGSQFPGVGAVASPGLKSGEQHL